MIRNCANRAYQISYKNAYIYITQKQEPSQVHFRKVHLATRHTYTRVVTLHPRIRHPTYCAWVGQQRGRPTVATARTYSGLCAVRYSNRNATERDLRGAERVNKTWAEVWSNEYNNTTHQQHKTARDIYCHENSVFRSVNPSRFIASGAQWAPKHIAAYRYIQILRRFCMVKCAPKKKMMACKNECAVKILINLLIQFLKTAKH